MPQMGFQNQVILRERERGLDTAIGFVELSGAWTSRELLLGGDTLLPSGYHLLGGGTTKLVSTAGAGIIMKLGCKRGRRFLGDIPSLFAFGGPNEALVVKVADL